ncbi:MAG: DUF927 domain-containing protein [Pseudomonadota bacterium]
MRIENLSDAKNFLKVKSKFIPEEIKNVNQWVVWKLDPKEDKSGTVHYAKVPYNPKTLRNAKSNDPSTWSTYKEALKVLKKKPSFLGIGFVLKVDDPFIGGDVDNCINLETGEMEEWAKVIIEKAETYTEYSPSGTGLRFIAIGEIPGARRKSGDFEIYDKLRFLTITGHHVEGTPENVVECPDMINNFYNQYIDPPKKELTTSSPKNTATLEELLDGGDCGYKSGSEADLACCNRLARKYGNDFDKIDKVFRESRRMRPKWDEKHYADGRTYGQATIQKAIESSKKYDGEESSVNPVDFALSRIGEEMPIALKDLPKALGVILDNDELIQAFTVLSEYDTRRYEGCLIRMKEKGLTTRDVDAIKRAIASERKKIQQANTDDTNSNDCILLKETLPDSPVPDTIKVPLGYTIDTNGVFIDRYRGKNQLVQELISYTPLLICKRLKNLNDGCEYVSLTWFRDNGWQSITIERNYIADPKLMLTLANQGFPVTTVTAKKIIGYLQHFEALNLKEIQCALLSSNLGWQGTIGKKGFLLGKRYVLPSGKKSVPADITKNNIADDIIYFKGRDIGEEQLANGICTKGTVEDWRRTPKLVSEFPVVTTIFLASLSAPLLGLMNVPNFTVDLSCVTSTGKTSALKFAASIWGNPNQSEPSSFLRSWNCTQVFVERLLGSLNGIPLILDDTKLVQDNKYFSKIIYETSYGQGRGRGSIYGTTSTSTWRTVLLSSGEMKITDLVKKDDAGTHGRVITICETPFGEKSNEIAQKINKLNAIISINYGHAGLRFIKYIIKNKKNWKKWKKRYNKLVKKYQELAGNNSICIRLSAYMAVIHLTGMIAEDCLNLTWDYEKHLRIVFKSTISEVKRTSNMPKEALKWVTSLAISKRDFFWYQDTDRDQPHQGWLGRWDDDGDLCFLTSVLQKILEDRGYEPNSILREWKSKGWLNTKGESNGRTKKVQIDKKRARCHVIHKKVIDRFG